MTKRERDEIYDLLYEVGERILREFNPCKWEGGLCAHMRLAEGNWKEPYMGCCESCKYFDVKVGCTTKNLNCKLFLCSIGDDAKNKECEGILRLLRQIAYKVGIKDYYYMSKEELFKNE